MRLTREKILGMTGEEIDRLLNEVLIPFFMDHSMGNRERHYSVNSSDADDAKQALRKLGLKSLVGEFEDGFAAVFDEHITRIIPFTALAEEREELAVARAALVAIVEKTDLFKM